jgi:polyribonucleotide nucleotidyltransferase
LPAKKKMDTQEKSFITEWLGRPLSFKTGRLAKQADSAVTVQYGDTVVLATVVESKQSRDGIDFFPLMVDFEERLYAAGIIKGSRWIKREGRPSDEAVLTGRMVDRSIRPLFDDTSRKDVQVVLTILSVDHENDYDIVALVAASAALAISGVKWNGPIGGIRVGRVPMAIWFLIPTYKDRLESDLDLIVAGTTEKVLMIEAGANEVPEDAMYEAIVAGQKQMQPAIDLINKMKAEVPAKPKHVPAKMNSEDEKKAEEEKEAVREIARKWLDQNIKPILFDKEHYTKGERKLAVTAIKEGLDKYLFEQGIENGKRKDAVSSQAEKAIDAEITRAIVDEGKRVDGRALTEIRELISDVNILPRNHGAGLFSRGETQVMSIVTLGAPGLVQQLEGLEGTSEKRYMHHYNFPPYSVGEARMMRGAGRREIGHGALAEKALTPMLPDKEAFPYVIRVVSETLGSNGSSSMASTCASSLALMDAGVPIKKAVGGIAMGLASTDDMSKWEVLTDLQDLEDGKGGMDFKITGSRDGITAIQLDTKTNGLTDAIIKKTLSQGRVALNQVLDAMDAAIEKPREDLSPYAPRITSFRINPDKIREVIGSGGKVINEIIAVTGVSIDIEDDGLVMVCGVDAEKVKEAVNWINDIVREFQAGEIFTGKVVRMLDFGAFIELTPGRDGMAHVSELAPYRIGKPGDFLSLGDEVKVKIKEIDDQGRVNLTLKGLPENEPLWKDQKGKQEGFSGGGNGDRGPRRDGGNGFRPRSNGNGFDKR